LATARLQPSLIALACGSVTVRNPAGLLKAEIALPLSPTPAL